jgi:5'-deoxynucleotidase
MRLEIVALKKLLTTLPPEIRPSYEPLLSSDNSDFLPFIKAADTLAAYIKCLEELKTGNLEFRLAAQQSLSKLNAMGMPEVEYFIENFIPAFSLSLDELDLSFEN